MELSCAHQTMGFLPGCNPYRKELGLNWKVQVLADGRLALGSLLPELHSLQKTALLFRRGPENSPWSSDELV